MFDIPSNKTERVYFKHFFKLRDEYKINKFFKMNYAVASEIMF